MVEDKAFITFSRGLALAVGPERHASVQDHSQDLGGGADWDSGAPQGDSWFQPVLTCVRGEEGDGRLMG